jgi:hypothetical protein
VSASEGSKPKGFDHPTVKSRRIPKFKQRKAESCELIVLSYLIVLGFSVHPGTRTTTGLLEIKLSSNKENHM